MAAQALLQQAASSEEGAKSSSVPQLDQSKLSRKGVLNPGKMSQSKYEKKALA